MKGEIVKVPINWVCRLCGLSSVTVLSGLYWLRCCQRVFHVSCIQNFFIASYESRNKKIRCPYCQKFIAYRVEDKLLPIEEEKISSFGGLCC